MEDIYEVCLRCGRKLKSEESRLIGYGKICYKKTFEDRATTLPLFHVKHNDSVPGVNVDSEDIRNTGGT